MSIHSGPNAPSHYKTANHNDSLKRTNHKTADSGSHSKPHSDANNRYSNDRQAKSHSNNHNADQTNT